MAGTQFCNENLMTGQKPLLDDVARRTVLMGDLTNIYTRNQPLIAKKHDPNRQCDFQTKRIGLMP